MDYPITSFHFLIVFNPSGVAQSKLKKHNINFGNDNDFAFQSVSGLDVQIETETIKEGGENRFEHTLPMRSKYSNLVLKRGSGIPISSALTDWCRKAFEQAVYIPLDLQVILLNEVHQPLVTWNIHHAWPINWKMGELNAEKGEILIETLELKYNYFLYKAGSDENASKKIGDLEKQRKQRNKETTERKRRKIRSR